MIGDYNILKGIIQLIVIIAMTLLFFALFSKKTQKLKKLFPLVLLFVWIGVAIMVGIEYEFFRESSVEFSLKGIYSLFKESLPMSLIFGSLVFLIKFRSLRKNQISN